MGAIHFSLDIELVKALRRTLPLQCLVETGTFRGDTTVAMAPLFAKVHTVELSQEVFAQTSRRLAPFANVSMIQGASPEAIKRLQPELKDQSVAYWLDAHWCDGVPLVGKSECPLLDEIKAIGRLNATSVILIDDARFFITPPPAPHRVADWPTLDQVVVALETLSDSHKLWIINDVFIFAPLGAEDDVVDYGRRRGIDLHKLYASAVATAKAVQARDATIQQLRQGRPVTIAPSAIPLDAGPGAPARFNVALASGDRSEKIFVFHLARLGLRRVLDVGANSGQFAARLRRLGYTGTIYSVEPQAQAYRELVGHAKDDPRWLPLLRQGAGKDAGFLDIHVSKNSVSSSLLEVHDNHIAAEPETRTVGAEKVYVGKSGDLLRGELMDEIGALKIDVQGFEQFVLDGYRERLGKVRLLLLEMSLVECYKGAPDMFSLDRFLTDELGFSRISFEPAYYDDRKGVIQQYDGIYYRPEIEVPAPAPEGVMVGAVITSVGGPIQRLRNDGADVGPTWRMECVKSWRRLAANVVSISETPPSLPQVQWLETVSKPTIAEIFLHAETLTDAHVVLTNADICLTEAFSKNLANLDVDTIYCASRHEVVLTAERPTELAVQGVCDVGFDVFILPPAFIRAVNKQKLFPDTFRIGETWWDYFLPVLAFHLGFPCKKLGLKDHYVLHYAHQAQFSRDKWRESGAPMLEALKALRKRKGSHAAGLLGELVDFNGPIDNQLENITRLVCFGSP